MVLLSPSFVSGSSRSAVDASGAAGSSAPNLSIALMNGTVVGADAIDGFFSTGGHTNNWAVLVCTSRFWFNYRHIANTLSMYRTVKRLGIPDSNIILMLADDVACNPRNKFPATVYNNNRRLIDLYGTNVEVDYRGYDVTVENLIRVLTGRVASNTPRSKRLLTDDRSNILVFLTGHGGEDFLKFQDAEELGAQDIADAFAQMHEHNRYHEIFFLIDTCQAASMYSKIYSPNILSAASSLTGESSYSHHVDHDIGVSVIDRFTYYNLETFEGMSREDQQNLANLFSTYDSRLMGSHAGIRSDLFHRDLSETLITDFFGGVQSVELSDTRYALSDPLTSVEMHHRNRVDEPSNPKFVSASSTPTAQNNVVKVAAPGTESHDTMLQYMRLVASNTFLCIIMIYTILVL